MKTLKAGTIKRLHVNRHVMAANRRTGDSQPALTVQTSNGPYRGKYIRISGGSTFVQSSKPLSCGARAWIKTKAEVTIYE